MTDRPQNNLERMILSELKSINRKLKWKNIMEWSTGEVKAQEGEKLLQLTILGGTKINVAIKENLEQSSVSSETKTGE